ncbi:MAG: dipeptide epimerase [Chthoniobacteraceae bacterium]
MEIQTRVVELHPRGGFRIARQRTAPYANVLLRVERDGVVGWGEASPNPFYGERAEDVRSKLEAAANWLRGRPLQVVRDIEKCWTECWPLLAPSRAAQCALDLALWDWLAKKEGITVSELACGRAPQPVTSFATIGLSTTVEFEAKLADLRGFPRIKIKSDARAEIAPIERARAAHGAELAVDANCAWKPDQLAVLSLALSAQGVLFIEQPFAPDSNSRLERGSYALPIFADESCVDEDDVVPLARHFDGINVKLVKCGGLTPALRLLRRARKLGLRTMVGCMIETSVLIAAGCVAAQIADFADLDGAWLIADDPCRGWQWENGVLHPPSGAGLGASPLQ